MPFMDYLKKAWEIIKLNKEVIGEMAADEKAVGPALGIVAISGVCWAIGALQPLGILYGPVVRLIGFFIFTGIVHFVATTFLGGKGEFKSFMVPVGLAIMVTWVSVIPLLGIALGSLAGLWVLVPAVLAAEHVYQVDRGKAVIAVVAPIVVFMILGGILMMVGLSMWAILGN
ncbi:MAG: YIP1 family protein [Candidatus Eisenbacteria bacterium]